MVRRMKQWDILEKAGIRSPETSKERLHGRRLVANIRSAKSSGCEGEQILPRLSKVVREASAREAYCDLRIDADCSTHLGEKSHVNKRS